MNTPGRCPCATGGASFFPRLADELFASAPGDPADPDVLGRATAADRYGAYTALRAGRLMFLPGVRFRTRMRAIKSSVVDPVSFALVEGRAVAAFPDVPGWSAQDTARRAVAEHLAWLRAAPTVVAGPPGEAEGSKLATLLGAARAALFLESLQGGDPELPLTITETARRLAERSAKARTVAQEALGHYREFAARRTPPPATTLAAMRDLVSELPAYAAG